MWGTKEDDADSGLEDKVKMGLTELTSPCAPQHLLDDNAAEAMSNEQYRSRGLLAPASLQGDKEIPSNVPNCVFVDI